MKKFMFLYKGFVTPTPEIGQAWMEWFGQVGDKMTDSGNPDVQRRRGDAGRCD